MKKCLHNLDFREIGLWLLVPFTCLISHTVLPIPPTLLGFLGAAVCALILFDPILGKAKKTFSLPISIVLPIIFVLYILFSQNFIGAPFTRVFGVWVSILYFVVFVYLASGYSVEKWKSKVDLFIKIAFVVFVVEAIWRYAHNIFLISINQNPFNWIYAFKYHSPMCWESNIVGIHMIIIMFFTYWWARYTGKNWYFIKIGFWILLTFTLSRTDWIAGIIGIIYFQFFYQKSLRKQLLYAGGFCLAGALFFGFILLPRISDDLSWLSKFDILENALTYYKNADIIEILFGVGIPNSDKVLGIYAHNYLLVFAIETGVFGLGLLIATLFYFLKITHWQALTVLLPFLVATSMALTTFLPDLYLSFAIMYLCISTKSTKFAK